MGKRRIWMAGHKGMVGSVIALHLERRGDEVLKADRSVVDLRNQIAVEVWLKQNRPDAIVFAAAKVGGIYANDTFAADFIYDDLAIETNVIHSAHAADVDRVAFLGSSCIYPKFAPQPTISRAAWYSASTIMTNPNTSTAARVPRFPSAASPKR